MRAIRNFLHEVKKNRTLFLMAIPGIVFFLVFCYFPMAGAYTAFTNYSVTKGIFLSPFVGLENFRFLFVTGTILNVTKNTILYNIAFITIGSLTQITAAIFISEIANRTCKKVSQSLMFLPYFVSYVLIGAFAYQLLNYEFGTVNTILKQLNLPLIDYYGNPAFSKYVIVFFYLWKNVGYGTIIYLAAITAISTDYYEAARIDGASVFKQIRYITLPLLKPTFIILLLLSLGNILRGQFELFYQLVGQYNGRLFDATDIIDTYAFRALITQPNYGRIGAVNLLQSVFGLMLVLGTNAIAKRVNEDYALF
jgi:putative aldouronate transport system permease protein